MTAQDQYTDAEEQYSFQEDLKGKWLVLCNALRQWRVWGLGSLVGALLGLAYYYLKPVTYTARTTFVVEDNKSSGGSLSAIAGQFGFDLGSIANSSSGILAGDNVLELLKSRSLIKKTLLSPLDTTTGETLADRYAASNGLKKKWQKSKKVGYEVIFRVDKQRTRIEDSLLQRMVKIIVEKDLSVSKPDRKLGFFELSVTMRDEQVTLLFSQRLLKAATAFYIETRTQRLATNVVRLQAKADTLERMLNKKTYSAAASNKMFMDLNPLYTAPEAVAEISSRDKMMQSTIYAEVIKNLELSKTALIQETPTVQVVDAGELPLDNKSIHLGGALLLGAMFGSLGGVISRIAVDVFKSN